MRQVTLGVRCVRDSVLMNREWLEATQSRDLEKIQQMLVTGVDINSLDQYGQTALMNAACTGSVDVVRLLIERGAELNHSAKYHLTALMLAVINQNLEIVKLLVEGGANISIRGSGPFEYTPLEYAERIQSYEISALLRAHT